MSLSCSFRRASPATTTWSARCSLLQVGRDALHGVHDGVVTLATAKGEMNFPFDEIEKARLVPKY